MDVVGDGPVLVVGPWYVDLIFCELARPVRPGTEVFAEEFDVVAGGAFTLAMALHRLGHQVVWVTDFGTDLFSRHVLARARAEGLDETGFAHHSMPVRNVTAVLSDSTDRAMVSFRDRLAAPSLTTVLERNRPRMLLLPILRYDADTAAGLDIACELGVEVFMDCQDVAGTLDDPALREVLGRVDMFAPNVDEALRLTGASTLDEALELLSAVVDTVIVKRGGAGATAVRRGRRVDVGAVAVTAVDTTGAGDCFNAGFVHATLRGQPLGECLSTAVACGAAAVTGLGSAGAPDLTELARWLAEVPRPGTS